MRLIQERAGLILRTERERERERETERERNMLKKAVIPLAIQFFKHLKTVLLYTRERH